VVEDDADGVVLEGIPVDDGSQDNILLSDDNE
jgi:hypothetical protein